MQLVANTQPRYFSEAQYTTAVGKTLGQRLAGSINEGNLPGDYPEWAVLAFFHVTNTPHYLLVNIES